MLFFQSNTVVIMQQQPAQVATTTTIIKSAPSQDHFFTLSVIMVIASFICGCAYLACTIPALIVSIGVSH